MASSSPRRIAFLRAFGFPFVSLNPPASAEPAPHPKEKAEEYTVRAALAKADSVLPLAGPPPHALIAADTVVVLKDRILGKPRDADAAYAMLRGLAGCAHFVVSGCALRVSGEPPVTFAVRSEVHMWACPEEMLRAYANSGEPLDKAGAYAVQGVGAFLVERVVGSWSNVVGLPLAELVRELARLGVIAARI